jgi:phosphopantothenoylcysteine decarboxylase / phosphopantothenate---cysteine ligase
MRICIGVGGGIAAYKAAELVRRLQERGFEVQVVMTRAACEFITPLTLASLSGRKVISGLFEGPGGEANIDSAIEHIAVAQTIDLLVVAPATADLLAKMARGHADDFLTTLHLATHAPLVIAPAMNVNMWTHPATQENLTILRSRGARIVEPGEGYLACGMTGAGRLAETDAIVAAVVETLNTTSVVKSLEGRSVLITAGPTQEDIDPVRYISNRSSGRMGYALAEAAAQRGAHVLLVSGPTALTAPAGVETVAVRSAADMTEAVLSRLNAADIVIMAAAVADYRPVSRAPQKIKKQAGALTIELESTRDILREIGARSGGRFVVGFAAETENLIENARKKLQGKNLDMIVANDVSGADSGFDSEFNAAVLLSGDGDPLELPRMTKQLMAGRILDEVALRMASPVKVSA